MNLNRNQVSHMQQAAWKLEEAINLMKKCGFPNGDTAMKKMKSSLDEINFELKNYTLTP